MEELIKTFLLEYGPLALGWPIAAYLYWDNKKLRDRLFNVVENNTRVITRLTNGGSQNE